MENADKLANATTHERLRNVGTFSSDTEFEITKREYFAGLAMQGHLSNPSENEIGSRFVLESIGLPKETKYSFNEHYTKYVSQIAIRYADELLKQLEETK